MLFDQSVVARYFPNLSELQAKQFSEIGDIYADWNAKINVVSRKYFDDFYIRHVLHSLSIAKFITFKDGSRVMDLGTGGGFPGVPLAIMFPNVEFILIDSIGKKIRVVNDAAAQLGLTNVTGIQSRSEIIEGPFDFIVTRAVARSAKLYQWSKKQIATSHKHEIRNGIICQKGGDLDEELKELNRPYESVEVKAYFKEDYFRTKKLIYIPF
ncbi:MAG: 16S rRNA (guanine(527)-N(7))-methyltransferase RsmG [Cytophagales bacterium]|nr:16S rRNA (guanine(527)-N(7))-methyltransferase RsmG [Cytophagales bacterium]